VGGLKLVKQPVMSSLILKRASASRPSGQWNDDDFDCSPTALWADRVHGDGRQAARIA
jgi:hypothetical protein